MTRAPAAAMNPPQQAPRAAVFVAEEGALMDRLPSRPEPESVRWRPNALAALYALQAHGYALVLLCTSLGERLRCWRAADFARFHQALPVRLEREGELRLTGLWACCGGAALQQLLPAVAQRHGLALERSWLLANEGEAGHAARRVGCRVMGWRPGPAADPLSAAVRILRRDGRLPRRRQPGHG